MTSPKAHKILVLASQGELDAGKRVWGSGGWLMPEEREALDWLTLLRVMGWEVTVSYLNEVEKQTHLEQYQWVVIACDPTSVSKLVIRNLKQEMLERPILVITRAADEMAPLSQLTGTFKQAKHQSGRHISWTGPGSPINWSSHDPIIAYEMHIDAGTDAWTTLNGRPIISGKRVGTGSIASLAFHPSEARDTSGVVTSLLRHLLTAASNIPVSWLDLEGTMILRMDDPGGAQNIYSKNWSYCKLDEKTWARIGEELKQRNASLSIGYISGWVDDADCGRGDLWVNGRKPTREAGAVYPSPRVKYLDIAGLSPGAMHDYESEYRGIQALRGAGLAEVELHGFTHMHPDTDTWAHSNDKCEGWPATSWYREFGQAARPVIATLKNDQHPLYLGLAAFREFFDTTPTTLIFPGEQWTNDALESALDFGFEIISSYYLAFFDNGKLCWSQHICAPYLDEPDASWFNSGLPVVGYFHDYEIAKFGVAWLELWLDRWQDAGAKRFMDFRSLSTLLSKRIGTIEDEKGFRISLIADKNEHSTSIPIRIGVYSPKGTLPATFSVCVGDREADFELEEQPYGFGTISLDLSDLNRQK